MSPSIPRRHHFVSQMVLRRFTDENGKLFFFNKRHPAKGVIATTPTKLFCERDLYTTRDKDGSMDVTLERYYADLEGRANPIIEKIVTSARNGHQPHLTPKEREFWDLFFYHQWSRVPDVRQKVLDQENIRILMGAVETRFQDPQWLERVKQNAMVDALGNPSALILDILRQKGLGIAVIRNRNKSFVIGSFPVVKLTNPGREHLADPTVEVWLPIAFDVMVSPASIRSADELIHEIRDDSVIRHLNRAIYNQSTAIAGRSLRLIASLAHLDLHKKVI